MANEFIEDSVHDLAPIVANCKIIWMSFNSYAKVAKMQLKNMQMDA